MVSFPSLGHLGRLGNQLFQIAATIGVALRNKDTFGLPPWDYERYFSLHNCFHISLPAGPEYREPQFAYTPIPYQPGLRLFGYFQSEKYFAEFADVIRSFFTTPREKLLGVAGIHVRRGDYLTFPEHHPVLPNSYYWQAIERMADYGISTFLVVSDDLSWCRQEFRNGRFEIVQPATDVEHLRLLAQCEHHIISNSSFAWWGAYLGNTPGSHVLYPPIWFGSAYQHSTADLFPTRWELCSEL